MAYGILRIEKIKASSNGEMLGRLKHSYGEFAYGAFEHRYEQTNWARNFASFPSNATEIFRNYKEKIKNVKQRPDAVGAFEIVITRSNGADQFWNETQKERFQQLAFSWLATTFGKENILGAVVHQDETVEHLHAFITPIMPNKKGELSLNAKHWTGGKEKLRALQNSAHAEIFRYFGLERGESSDITHRKNQRPQLNYAKKTLETREKALNSLQKDLDDKNIELQEKEANLARSKQINDAAFAAKYSQLQAEKDEFKQKYKKQLGQPLAAETIEKDFSDTQIQENCYNTNWLTKSITKLRNIALTALRKYGLLEKAYSDEKHAKEKYQKQAEELDKFDYRKKSPAELIELSKKKQQQLKNKNQGWSMSD